MVKIKSDFIPKVVDPWMNTTTDQIVFGMQKREHQISGTMKKNTVKKKIAIANYQAQVNTRYANIENNRPGSKGALGSHRFVEPTLQELFPRSFNDLNAKTTQFFQGTIGVTFGFF